MFRYASLLRGQAERLRLDLEAAQSEAEAMRCQVATAEEETHQDEEGRRDRRDRRD